MSGYVDIEATWDNDVITDRSFVQCRRGRALVLQEDPAGDPAPVPVLLTGNQGLEIPAGATLYYRRAGREVTDLAVWALE